MTLGAGTANGDLWCRWNAGPWRVRDEEAGRVPAFGFHFGGLAGLDALPSRCGFGIKTVRVAHARTRVEAVKQLGAPHGYVAVRNFAPMLDYFLQPH